VHDAFQRIAGGQGAPAMNGVAFAILFVPLALPATPFAKKPTPPDVGKLNNTIKFDLT
jgi:hypothetical protein